MRLLTALLLILAAFPILATDFESCPSTCTPPTGNIVLGSRPPYDAPVKFGSIAKENGATFWLWTRVGDPSKPCTSAQLTSADPYDPKACKVKVGEVLLATAPVRAKVPKR